ncbi:hypothetical protein GCK69_20885 [Yersinia pestis]|nr:hypothetical protein EGX87_01630 [Yersinia pseudotuberculosis]QFR74429.1 hypothetical protein GCK69_20885 [Yersinia pestis]
MTAPLMRYTPLTFSQKITGPITLLKSLNALKLRENAHFMTNNTYFDFATSHFRSLTINLHYPLHCSKGKNKKYPINLCL